MDASISASEVIAAAASPTPPLVIDVRRNAAFLAAPDMALGALRRDPDTLEAWAGDLPRTRPVMVYCVHGHEVSQKAAAALRARGISARFLEGGLEEGWKPAGGALMSKPRQAGTRWITRERPKIDRIACPWLVTRFIDPRAEFLYVPADQVRTAAAERDAIAYDVPGVHFSHDGARCSFDAFLKTYRLADPALAWLAVIVRGADTNRLDLAPQAPGLLAISLGLSHLFHDDHEMLRHGMVVYDALYRWCVEHARDS